MPISFSTIFRHAVLVGIGAGVLCFLYFLTLYNLGLSPLGLRKELNLGFVLIAMGIGLWYYRQQVRAGYLHLWEGLTLAYGICLVAALTSGVCMYAFLTWGDASVLTNYIQDNLQIAYRTKAQFVDNFGESSFKELLASLQKTSAFDVLKDEVFKKTFWGIILGLPLSMALRKQNYGVMQPGAKG